MCEKNECFCSIDTISESPVKKTPLNQSIPLVKVLRAIISCTALCVSMIIM